MPLAIRLLSAGDEATLALLAADEDDFNVLGGSSRRVAVSGDDAAAYLADSTVLHWVAEEEGQVVGHLLSYVQRRRAGAPRQLLLYEVGVRRAYRRRGVGRSLVTAMLEWMREEGVPDAWVLADNPGAKAFYAACGFTPDQEQPTQMTLTL